MLRWTRAHRPSYPHRMSTRRPDTIADLLARPESDRLELIRGTIIAKPGPSIEHADAQAGVVVSVGSQFQRSGGGVLGAWRFFTELELQLNAEVLLPDVCGYRRERMPERLSGRLITLVPDWICEVLSSSNASRDRVEKLASYFQAEIPHYWLIDPVEGTLEVFRRTDLAYAMVLSAHRGQRVRAEPFDAVEFEVDELLGADSARS